MYGEQLPEFWALFVKVEDIRDALAVFEQITEGFETITTLSTDNYSLEYILKTKPSHNLASSAIIFSSSRRRVSVLGSVGFTNLFNALELRLPTLAAVGSRSEC